MGKEVLKPSECETCGCKAPGRGVYCSLTLVLPTSETRKLQCRRQCCKPLPRGTGQHNRKADLGGGGE